MALKDNEIKYNQGEIRRAGEMLRKPDDLSSDQIDWALEVLNNYRVCHAYPINTLQATLRKKINKLGYKSLVSQRLKRTPSILAKLIREKSRLNKMQDIGGLRAILGTMQEVEKLIEVYKSSKFRHELIKENDYITKPKSTGYRSYHLIYEYNNLEVDRFNGLFLELQIRTKLQHAWATAVETMGTFINQPLKSNEGPQEYKDFFALVGDAFTILENCPRMERFKHFSDQEIFYEVKKEAKRLDIITKLESFNIVANAIKTDKKKGGLHLVILDVEQKQVIIQSFAKNSLKEASEAYLREEALAKDEAKRQVVLVTSGSIDNLKKAYPSYFLDTEEFISKVKEIIRMAN